MYFYSWYIFSNVVREKSRAIAISETQILGSNYVEYCSYSIDATDTLSQPHYLLCHTYDIQLSISAS